MFVAFLLVFSSVATPILAAVDDTTDETNTEEQTEQSQNTEEVVTDTASEENAEDTEEQQNVEEPAVQEQEPTTKIDSSPATNENLVEVEADANSTNTNNVVAASSRAPQTFNFDDLVADGIVISPKVTYQQGNGGHSNPLDGSEMTPGTSNKIFNVSIDIADSFNLVEGDTFSFVLPEGLNFNYTNPPNGTPVLTPDKVEFGQMFLDNGVLKIIFNDHFVGKINRNFFFKMQVSIKADASLEGKELTFEMFGKSYSIDVIPAPTGGVVTPHTPGHNKRTIGNSLRTETHGRIGWEIRINNDASLTMRNVVIKDRIGPGMRLVTDLNSKNIANRYAPSAQPSTVQPHNIYNDTFVMQAWNPNANIEWYQNSTPLNHKNYCKLDESKTKFDSDGRGFEITLTEVNQVQCYIYYETELIDMDDINLTFSNTATIIENGSYVGDVTSSNQRAYDLSAGGNANIPPPILYTLNVKKLDGTTNNLITSSPAKFKLVRSDGVEIPEISTVNGIATFAGIPKGTYSIVETVAPSGYGVAPPQTIVIPSAGQTSTTYEAEVKNYQSGSVKVQKVVKGTTTQSSA